MEGQAERIQPARPPIDMKPSPALSIMLKAVADVEGRKIGVLVSDGTDGAGRCAAKRGRKGRREAAGRGAKDWRRTKGKRKVDRRPITQSRAVRQSCSMPSSSQPRPREPRCCRKKPPPSTGCAMRSAISKSSAVVTTAAPLVERGRDRSGCRSRRDRKRERCRRIHHCSEERAHLGSGAEAEGARLSHPCHGSTPCVGAQTGIN